MNSQGSPSTVSSSPLRPRERIQELDVIRGFALFGILLVNMALFKSLVDEFALKTPADMSSLADQVGSWVILLFAESNFYAIFSFLFGLGFYIFLERVAAKSMAPTPLYSRRLVGLMLFGLVHLVFIWTGDILFTYSVIGFLLLVFRRVRLDALAKWIVALFVLAVLIEGGLFFILALVEVFLGDKVGAEQAAMMEQAVKIFKQGSYLDILLYRLSWEVWGAVFQIVYWMPSILAYFLCGLYAAKRGIFKDVEGNLPFIRRVWRWGLALGGFFTLLNLLVGTEAISLSSLWQLPLMRLINHAGAIFLSAFYVSSLVLLLRREIPKRVLSVLAAPGRMALTNYLSQSVICVFIFYGYGLGYFNQVSVWGGIGLTAAIVSLQVIWSNLWLARFNYGPLEWLWRYFTYRQKPAMKPVPFKGPSA